MLIDKKKLKSTLVSFSLPISNLFIGFLSISFTDTSLFNLAVFTFIKTLRNACYVAPNFKELG